MKSPAAPDNFIDGKATKKPEQCSGFLLRWARRLRRGNAC